VKVTIIPCHQRRGEFSILLDEEPVGKIHGSIFGWRPSFPKMVATIEEWRTLFDEKEYRQAKNYTLRRLSKQSYYSGQLAKLLKEKFVQPKTIQRLVTEAQELGFLDDEAWLQMFIRSHLRRYGKRAVYTKLLGKGVSREEAQRVIEKECSSEEEAESIQHLIRTRYRSRDFSDRKEKQKVIASLMRKGFSLDLICAALKE